MPIYEYECEACHGRFEVKQKFSDKPLKKCAKCGAGPIAKVLSAPALVFKGTGWYVTDYARPARERTKTKGDKADGDAKGNGGSASSEGSPAAAPATSTAPSVPAAKD